MKQKMIQKSALFVILIAIAVYGCENITDSPISEPEENQPVTEQFIEGSYIVVLNKHQGKILDESYLYDVRNNIMEKASISDENVTALYNKTIQGFAAKLSEAELEKIQNDRNVAYVEKDRIVTLAPPCGTPKGGPCDDPDDPGDGDTEPESNQETPWGITRVGGATSYTGSNVAWVIDTGIQLDHPDLIVDAARGFTAFTSGPDAKDADDRNGHGTHVAGTIAAINNDRDVVGVAAGATLVPVKVLDRRGSGSYSGVIAGVDYVAANGAAGDVANMSLGGPVSNALDDAVRSAADQGVMFVVSAGNSSDDANNYSPARVDYPNVYTISAIDSNDVFATFSNYSNPPIEFAAPGVSILSTWTGSGTRSISGTSMASPHAAGVLLLTGGNASSSGTALNDPDGNADAVVYYSN